MSGLDKKIVLASGSPRRKEILEGIRIPFRIYVKEVDEDLPEDIDNREAAEFLALKKANAYLEEIEEDEIYITSDTTVICGDRLMNKPQGAEEAKEMLSFLSGKVHEVITGVCLLSKEKKVSFAENSKVYFSKLSDDEIDHYIEEYKPFDKAGSYGIQEWMGMVAIEKIEGSFYNIMGLPVHRIYQELKNF